MSHKVRRPRPLPPRIAPLGAGDVVFVALLGLGLAVVSVIWYLAAIRAAAGTLHFSRPLLLAPLLGGLVWAMRWGIPAMWGARADQRGVFVPQGLTGWVLYPKEEISRVEWDVVGGEDGEAEFHLSLRGAESTTRILRTGVKRSADAPGYAKALGRTLSLHQRNVIRVPRPGT
jgi:hypothetical protein